MALLHDAFDRRIDYLRISVTDRCNMRCQYCMPAEGMAFAPREELLSFDEIVAFVREVAVPLGITKLRLTGGEPLVRPGLPGLAARLAALPEIRDLALTTNGALLTTLARDLQVAGVTRLNISLDTLRPERFREMTRGGDFQRVWEGLETSERLGFAPLKLNCVVMRGFNEDELVDFVALTLQRPWHVRFIEFMPVGDYARFQHLGYVSSADMQARIAERHRLEPLAQRDFAGNGPARYWQVQGALGSVGFISQMSHDFCASCNRVRLTADGRFRHCLLSDHELDLRALLRSGGAWADIREAIALDLQRKPQRHFDGQGISGRGRTMSQIGG
ncbi:MAG: GTP 3',8-cyclase MoaA [Candidatus Sericytochromatia bacterium]|nr:GTP 3',8-cyclase MoaA [Candidatus Sericytochromatia bacterium]